MHPVHSEGHVRLCPFRMVSVQVFFFLTTHFKLSAHFLQCSCFRFYLSFSIEYLFVSYRVNITLAHAEKLIGSRRQIFLFFFSSFRIKSMNLSLLVEICVYVTTLILKCNIWITGTEVASYIRLIKYLYASNYYVMYEIVLFWPRCSIWVLIYFFSKSIPSLSHSLLHLQLIYRFGRSLTGFEYRWL